MSEYNVEINPRQSILDKYGFEDETLKLKDKTGRTEDFKKHLFEYLNEYTSCLNSFSNIIGRLYLKAFNSYEFERGLEDDSELEDILHSLKELCDKIEKTNNLQMGIIESLKRYDYQEMIHLDRIGNYRHFLNQIYRDEKMLYEALAAINEYIKDNGDNHYLNITRTYVKQFIVSYYSHNVFINALSDRIVISDEKGDLLRLRETIRTKKKK